MITKSDMLTHEMPPIVVKIQKIDTTFVNAVKIQANDLVSFEYTSGGLNIRTRTNNHMKIINFFREYWVEFYFFNPNPGQQVRYVVRGFPLSTSCDKILTRLREREWRSLMPGRSHEIP